MPPDKGRHDCRAGMTEFRLTREELGSGLHLAARLQSRSRASVQTGLLVGAATLGFTVYLYPGSPRLQPGLLCAVAALALLTFIIMIVLPPILGAIWTRARWRPNPALQDSTSVEISEAGITYQAAAGHWTRPWRNQVSMAQNDGVMVICLGPNRMHVLPKRILSAADIALIEDNMRRRADAT